MLAATKGDRYCGVMIKYRDIYSKKIHISFLPLGLCLGFLAGALLATFLAWSLP